MPKRSLHLVAYDVADRRARTRALKACKAHGIGGQKSAHECLMTRRERRELRKTLGGIIDQKSDRLLVIRFHPGTEILGLGQATPPPQPCWFYVG